MAYQGIAPAKINLSLDIVGRRADGYHELRSVMQALSLADVVEVELAQETTVWASDENLPCDESNLAWRAYRLLDDEFALDGGVRVRLDKQIPLGGGMAGGSTDAAQVLLAVNELFELGLTVEELCSRAVKLGADVPFCVLGGAALAEGVGEKLTRLDDSPELRLVLVNPGFAVPTPAVYRQFDEVCGRSTDHTVAVLTAWESGNPWEIAEACGNGLEQAAFALYPQLAVLKAEMESLGLCAVLCGSGATVFGVARDKKQAAIAADALMGRYPFVRAVTSR